jgi:molybdopterin/thiamine biosynthesis adenylyltransferase
MHLLISDEFLTALRALPGDRGVLWGSRSDRGSVARLVEPTGRNGQTRLGRWVREQPGRPVAPEKLGEGLPAGRLVLVLSGATTSCYLVERDKSLRPQAFEQVRLYTDYHARTEGLFDPTHLPTRRVVIAGLGSGGSAIAAELARAGVGQFVLVDFDRLSVPNLARHICGLADLGRLKTAAVADFLRSTSLVAKVETHELDVTSDPERLEKILAGADLLIGATDSEEAKACLNRAAWKAGIPAVYAAAYDFGFGGDIFLALPPGGACYECFRQATNDMFSPPEDVTLDYGKTISQPALGLDVRFVSLIAARVALAFLLGNDTSSRLSGYPTNWVLWGNWPQPGWIFDRPLMSEYIQIDPDPLCPVCHSDAYSQAYLGLSADEAAAEVKALLAQLPSIG